MARTGMKDHPRIRGEHGHAWRTRLKKMGSSPHTRGALPWTFKTA